MKKVEDYRAHAAECRAMANRVRTPEDKAMLMNMAATWESLAADRQKRISEPDKPAQHQSPSISSTLRTMTETAASARRQVLPNNRPPRRAAVASDSGHKPPPALQKKIGVADANSLGVTGTRVLR